MKNLQCLIIEDQLHAQRVLRSYIAEVPYLQLIDACIAPLEALHYLESKRVDLLFLDIHLPKISGIDLLRSLAHKPAVIITTAFSDYALEGFELDVVDYLLKPFSFERFLKAIAKIQDSVANEEASIVYQKYLFVRSKQVIQKIEIEQIKYVEAKGDFVLLCTLDQRHIANISLQNILPRLGKQFVRCHKSFIVNLNAIDKIIGNQVKIADATIPIGRTYREIVLEKLRLI